MTAKTSIETTDSTQWSNEDSVMIIDSRIDTRCGAGTCSPALLQRLSTIQSFVGFYAVSNLFSFSLRMLLISQVTTIEKRFGLNSSQSGFVLSSSQITFLLFILFFSHYGRDSHIPRILSVTSFIAGITGLMFATAHFLPVRHSGRQQRDESSPGNITWEVCRSPGTFNISETGRCQGETEGSGLTNSAMTIFVVAMLIQGVMTSPRSPLGGTYIDDNNPVPTKTGKYIGVMMGILTLAPMVAFGIGALSGEIYHTLEKTDLTSRDPRWIGAWWLGFLVLGLISMVTATFIFFFPKRMKTSVLPWKKEISGLTPGNSHNEREDKPKEKKKKITQLIKGPFLGILRVVSKPVFTLTVMVGSLQAFAMLGMATFIPKYLETQFYVPTVKTNVMLGAVSILGNTLGPICGGIVTSRYKLSTLNNLKLVLFLSILLTVGAPIGMFIAGQQTNLVRPILPGNLGHSGVVNGTSCVGDCHCEDKTLYPVCGSDGSTYYSPCHAGCHSKENGTYADCRCTNGSATPGFCADEDPVVYILLVYFTFTTFILTFPMSSSFMIIVRSVSERDKALALGLSSFVSTLLGHFPGPIVYGKLVDTACILWQDGCSGRGACALYHLTTLRYNIFGTNMGLFFLATLCVLFALLYHSRKLKEEERKRGGVGKVKCDSDLLVLNTIT